MLRAALLWMQVVPDEEIPEDLHHPHACSKELAEVPRLCRRCPNMTRRPVLDVPGDQQKVRGEVALVLAGVVIGHNTGGRNHCGSGAVERRGRWRGELGFLCCVVVVCYE